MSQTITPGVPPASPAGRPPGPPGAAGSAGPTLATRLSSAAGTVRDVLSGSPGHLRIAAALAIVAALAVAIGGAQALRVRSSALAEARSSAQQLVLLQGVQTTLVQADADVTNAFLQEGLEPTAQRADYLASIDAASRNVTAVARAADQRNVAALGQVNADLSQYTSLIGAARANNRVGNPVAANYLSVASSLLRTDALPPLQRLSDAESARVDAAYRQAGHAWIWFVVLGLGGLLLLAGVQVWLAQQSRRIVNMPLVVASGALAVALLLSALVMLYASARAGGIRDGEYARAAGLANARVAAFDAKSDEALNLIKRGSGDQYQTPWTAAMAKAGRALPVKDGEARDALDAYAQAHKAIRAQDDNFKWDAAVTLATGTGSDSANAHFLAFAQDTKTTLDQQVARVSDGLGSARAPLTPTAWLVLVVGLVAAGAAWWGVSLRLDEYR